MLQANDTFASIASTSRGLRPRPTQKVETQLLGHKLKLKTLQNGFIATTMTAHCSVQIDANVGKEKV